MYTNANSKLHKGHLSNAKYKIALLLWIDAVFCAQSACETSSDWVFADVATLLIINSTVTVKVAQAHIACFTYEDDGDGDGGDGGGCGARAVSRKTPIYFIRATGKGEIKRKQNFQFFATCCFRPMRGIFNTDLPSYKFVSSPFSHSKYSQWFQTVSTQHFK